MREKKSNVVFQCLFCFCSNLMSPPPLPFPSYSPKTKMFDGVPDQFHQFIGAPSPATARTTTTTTTTLLLPLSFTSFDPLFTSSSNSHHQYQLPPQFLQPLHQQKNNEESTSLVAMNMEINETDQRSMAEPIDNLHHHHQQQQQQAWSNDEVLALLRVRSSMETWFPEFTWEHVSRKLAELGFKRSAEKCKEKFEEESRYFNTINCSKNYRIFSELEQLCQAENPPPPHHPHHHHQEEEEEEEAVVADESNKNVGKSREEEEEDNIGQNLGDDSRNIDELYQTSPANNNNAATSSDQDNKIASSKNKNKKNKRKRVRKLEMFKGFCEDIVNKLMVQQEEMHNKLLEDMVKRDEEKVAREEAWKKQELDRINMELELRAKAQAVAGDRQATIIKFLSKFSQNGSSKRQCLGIRVPNECSNPPFSASSSSVPVAENPNPIVHEQNKVDQVSTTTSSSMVHISMAENQSPQNPNPKTPQNPNSPLRVKKPPQNPTSNDKADDLGKRWPRDEVLALINLRSSLFNNGDPDKEGAAVKAPLWERISQGMLDLGYKRSAKRCKEKWENINKYFRKTKDVNKKRSLDSRTCPYFHQLSTLYGQGTLTGTAPSEGPENHPKLPETAGTDPSRSGADESTVQVPESDETETNNIIQVPGFEFEF